METIEVTARFLAGGELQVLHFIWRGQRYDVESTGRRWQAADGLHLLVQSRPAAMFELLYDLQAGRWFINRRTPVEDVL